MNKSISITIIAVVLALGVSYIYKDTDKKEVAIVVSDYKNTSYMIDGQSVTLVDGVSEVQSVPGSASKTITKYFGNEVMKDLNGDGREDTAFLLTQETGGSGTFFYIVVALNIEQGPVGSEAYFLGDRITPQSTEISQNPDQQDVIIVKYLEHTPDESMASQPSVGQSLWLKFDPATMQFGEVAQHFEGEADPNQMSLSMKTWKWVKAQYSDGKIITPKKDSFTLTLKKDGTFNATTDCNAIGGKYVAIKNAINFKDMFSTKMYCEGSQESDFEKILATTGEYLFTSKGELVLNIKFDSGSVYFK